MQRLPIFFKQREDQFYPAWAFNLPAILTRLPYTLLEVLIWTALTYYIVGLAPDAGRCAEQAALRIFGQLDFCKRIRQLPTCITCLPAARQRVEPHSYQPGDC